jgi:hypothetical protein
MKQTKSILLLLFIVVHYTTFGQNNCDELHTLFTTTYTNTIRSLHASNPQKADSIYQVFKKKYDAFDCHTYTVMSKFITTHSHLLFHALKDYTRDDAFLETYRNKYRGTNDSLYVMVNNFIALHALQKNNFPKMKSYIVEANEVAEAKLDPVFYESTRTTTNLALYYDWLNMENQCIKVYQKNLDLIVSKKITDLNFRYEAYKSMYGFYLELENAVQAKCTLIACMPSFNHSLHPRKINGCRIITKCYSGITYTLAIKMTQSIFIRQSCTQNPTTLTMMMFFSTCHC